MSLLLGKLEIKPLTHCSCRWKELPQAENIHQKPLDPALHLGVRDLDPNEDPAQAGDLYLLFQEPGGRGSCACANALRRRPGQQINAGLVGYSQSGVILYIEGVS